MDKSIKIDVIITTGGTGLTGRDITPEAVNEIADKHIPGFGEVFRTISLKTVGTSAIQSRACAVLLMESMCLLYRDHQEVLRMLGMEF